ncbi:hypothetical protein [Litoreibacter roseus]|uniref:Uncharacterized protein n=1 Tax=Litoreibacter roseus TaxID=2601869 RepID=A0A6N6JM79_9RHOB|nr:hypothetical protein [Litoreibacter roseus]GFE66292.1 hypothetical protein KIN_33660 [Litoreibacter roseus]
MASFAIDDDLGLNGPEVGAPRPTKKSTETLGLPDLPFFDVVQHEIKVDADVELNGLAKLFDLSAGKRHFLILRDIRRFRIIAVDGKEVREGIAVRLTVNAKNLSAKVGLSVPNIAAQVQISNATAQASLRVIGYNGPLAGEVQFEDDFGVNSYAKLAETMNRIKDIMFQENNRIYWDPKPLAFDT